MDSMMGYDDWKTTEPFDPYMVEWDEPDDGDRPGEGDEDEDGGLE